MKKTLTIAIASAILSTSAALASTPMNASAFENVLASDLPKYYDFNRDNSVNISDLVVGFQLLDEGCISTKDVDNVYDLIFNREVEVGFEEFDIDALEATPENISYIQMVCSGYCCDSEIDGDCSRYRVINDGKITEIRCSTPGDPNSFSVPISHDIMNPFSVSNGKFVTRPAEFTYSFCLFNSLSCNAEYVRQTFDTCKFEKLDVTAAGNEVYLYFSSFNHTTEFVFTYFAETVEPIGTFQYDGTEVHVGITAEGKVAISEVITE